MGCITKQIFYNLFHLLLTKRCTYNGNLVDFPSRQKMDSEKYWFFLFSIMISLAAKTLSPIFFNFLPIIYVYLWLYIYMLSVLYILYMYVRTVYDNKGLIALFLRR